MLPNYTDTLSLFAILDGHGGPEVALFVADNFPIFLKANANFQKQIYDHALFEAFLSIDDFLEGPDAFKEVLKYHKPRPAAKIFSRRSSTVQSEDQANSKNAPTLDYRGTTANIVLVDHEKKLMYVANAGDSRSVLYSKNETTELSVDHKPYLPTERERIEKAGSRIDEETFRIDGVLNLSRAIGDFAFKKTAGLSQSEQAVTALPDVRRVPIPSDEGSYLMIACDGIWGCLTSKRACDFMNELKEKNKQKKLSKSIGSFLDYLISPDCTNESYEGCDNMSCLVVEFNKKQKKSGKKD